MVELLFVIVILGILAMLVVPYMGDILDRVRAGRVKAEIAGMERSLEAYFVDNQRYPDSLADLDETGAVELDAWGRPYKYLRIANDPGAARTLIGVPINEIYSYDLYSLGKDGLSGPDLVDAGSEDDIVRARQGAYLGLASDL